MEERPLSHIRVLDFGQYLAGPLAGMMLADMGAEVIRIDPPGGPRFKSPASDMISRGKLSLTLDLKTESGRETAIRLCRRSDVAIENFRPGVMKGLRLGPEEMLGANPRIVSLSLPGFASTDPELAHLPAWEAIIAARTGQFTDMGLNRRLMGINPSFTPLALASAYGAAFGAMAVLLALAAREKNGGDHIEIPLASALMEGLAYNCQRIENYPERYKSPREAEIDRREKEGLPMKLTFGELSEFLDPFYRTYPCADARGFYVVCCSVSGHPQRALKTLGLGEMADQLPDFDAYLDRSEWPAEWSLRNYPVGGKDRERISSAMKEAFLKRPSHEWEALFGAAKAPATAQRSTREWLRDPHALASGLVLEADDPRYGRMRQMGNVAWLADDEMATLKQAALSLDVARERLDAILREPIRSPPEAGDANDAGGSESSGGGAAARAEGDTSARAEHASVAHASVEGDRIGSGADSEGGVSAEAPASQAEAGDARAGGGGGWLDGVKMLDLTNVIAGPTIGSTLARFGAEVISAQPVEPSVDPWNAVVFGLHANRGKKSLLLNLKSPKGQEALERLMAESDVVAMNGSDEQRDRIGLSPERLEALYPRLILVQLDAFGGPARGPKSDHLGYDDLAQAATGVMLRFGGGMETPEEHAHFGTIDALTGFCACVSLAAALERRNRTGKGGIARASLAAAGNLIQAQFMHDCEGRKDFDEPSGREALGWGAFYRCYEAADGWMFLAAPEERGEALREIPELADLAEMDEPEIASALAERFAKQPSAYWSKAFEGGSSAAMRLGSLLATRDSALQRESQGNIDLREATFRAIRHDDHPMGRWVDLVAPNAVRPKRGRVSIPGHAPKYGEHTREILSRLGYRPEEIDEMIRSGAAGEKWSERYLPE